MKTNDSALKNTWKLMILDLTLLIAEWIVPVVDVLIMLVRYGDAESTSSIAIYLLWTMRCLRLLIWIAMVLSLAGLSNGFRTARVWYLLRILIFVLSCAYAGIGGALEQQISTTFFSGRVTIPAIIQIVLVPILTPLLLPFGNRAILTGSADLLAYFGMEKPAQANRRLGNRLAGTALAFVLLILVSIVIIVAGGSANGINEMLQSADVSGLVKAAVLLPIFLILPACLGLLVLWGIGAIRMKRVYTLIKEMSE